MQTKVKVYPPTSFFIAFLGTRNVELVDDKAQVLHYFGNSYRELKSLVKKDSPDLVVVNSNSGFMPKDLTEVNFSFVIDTIESSSDIFKTSSIVTNSFDLCQLYYMQLALTKEVEIVYKKEKTKPIWRIGIIDKLFDIMHWS
jgi:hypothetical protein